MFTSRAILATSLTLLACVPAAAQYRPERPYRGIFASGIDAVGQSLVTQASLSGGYDDDVRAGFNQSNALRSRYGGRLAQLTGSVNYLVSLPRVSLTAGAGSTFRYYPTLTDDVFDTHNARVGGVVSIFRQPSLTAHGAISYQPYTFYSAFPESDVLVEPAAPPEADFVPVATQYVSYTAGADFNERLSRRTTLFGSYTYYSADRLERDFWRQGGGASLRYNLTRNVSVRLGYYYTEGHYDDTHLPEPPARTRDRLQPRAVVDAQHHGWFQRRHLDDGGTWGSANPAAPDRQRAHHARVRALLDVDRHL